MDQLYKNIWHNDQEEQLIKALNSSSLISITNPNGIIIYVNDAFCEISGYNEQELLGKSLKILNSGKQPNGMFKSMRALISNNRIWKGKICNRKKDGSFYWLNATIIPFVDGHGNIEKYVGIHFDFTKSKENKSNLKFIQNKFKILFDGAHDAYFFTDLNGQILECNTATETMTGYKKIDLINKNIEDLEILNNTDKIYFSKALKIASKNPHRYEFQITSKKGKKMEVEIIASHIVIDGEPLVLNIAQNITERKNILKKLQEKTNDLELLLYRSGHDLRAPFTSLEGLLNLIKNEPLNKNSLELIAMFEKVLSDGKMLVDNLSASSLMLNRSFLKEEVDLNDLVNQILGNLKHLDGYNTISFNINIQKEFKLISNPQLLGSILQNLLQNAIKYHRPLTNTHTPFIIINAFKTKDGIKITVKDNGKGINQDELDKVFNLYYRSSTSEKGSGLGLYIAKNSVEQLGGVISIKSVVNKETQLDIELPNFPL